MPFFLSIHFHVVVLWIDFLENEAKHIAHTQARHTHTQTFSSKTSIVFFRRFHAISLSLSFRLSPSPKHCGNWWCVCTLPVFFFLTLFSNLTIWWKRCFGSVSNMSLARWRRTPARPISRARHSCFVCAVALLTICMCVCCVQLLRCQANLILIFHCSLGFFIQFVWFFFFVCVCFLDHLLFGMLVYIQNDTVWMLINNSVTCVIWIVFRLMVRFNIVILIYILSILFFV